MLVTLGWRLWRLDDITGCWWRDHLAPVMMFMTWWRILHKTATLTQHGSTPASERQPHHLLSWSCAMCHPSAQILARLAHEMHPHKDQLALDGWSISGCPGAKQEREERRQFSLVCGSLGSNEVESWGLSGQQGQGQVVEEEQWFSDGLASV